MISKLLNCSKNYTILLTLFYTLLTMLWLHLDWLLYTVTMFLDFSKAFDTINKTIMLRKLDRYGFRNDVTDFLNSYLSDRKMYVRVNGSDTTVRTTNFIDLPQGSVTSPCLYCLYINDMHRTSDKLNFIHFADGTTVYMSGRDLKALCENVCEELSKVDEWLKANRLSLNIDKTFFMIHTHNHNDINSCIIRIRDRLINNWRAKRESDLNDILYTWLERPSNWSIAR